jgi:hypothetical protein
MNYSDIVTYSPGNLPTVASLGMQGFEQGSLGVPPLPRMTFAGNDAFTTIKYGPTNGFGEAALSMTTNIFTVADSVLIVKGIYDPQTSASAGSGAYTRKAFAGNVIPASRLDPTALKILSYFPLPNLPGNNLLNH